jgi:ectoine hydroxylase-related dioxygenase (phytanoyl-CoA dioxygenase family)
MSVETDYVQHYELEGVLLLPRLLDPNRLAEIDEALVRYERDVVPNLEPGDRVFEADGKTLRNLWRMQEHDPFFADLAANEAIISLVSPLVRGEPLLMGVETFCKPAQVGSAVPPHQDNAYFCWDPPDALTVWVALDAVTQENGPVYYVRGSHRQGTRPHVASGVAGNSVGLEEVLPAHEPFAPALSPGDALIHHANTVHYSAPNESALSRRALLIVYRGAHCVKDPELLQRYQGG